MFGTGAAGIRGAHQSRLSQSSGSSQASSLANSRSSDASALDAAEHLEKELQRRDVTRRGEVDPLDFLVQDWWAHKDSPETDKMTPLTPKIDDEATSEPSTPQGESALRTPLANGLRAIREQCRKGTSPLEGPGVRTPDLRTPLRMAIGSIREKLAESLPAEDGISAGVETMLPDQEEPDNTTHNADAVVLDHMVKKLQQVREVGDRVHSTRLI